MSHSSAATPHSVLPGILLVILLVSSTLLAGCAGTRVDNSHPLVSEAGDRAAQVYFIRPRTERYLGFADNALSIEAWNEPLLRMIKGEYTLATLRPGTVRLTARSDSNHGPEFRYREMVNSQEFEFRAGQTYFVTVTPFDGEFRGVHFVMETVDLPRAKELSQHLRVVGPARSAPIRRL